MKKILSIVLALLSVNSIACGGAPTSFKHKAVSVDVISRGHLDVEAVVVNTDGDSLYSYKVVGGKNVDASELSCDQESADLEAYTSASADADRTYRPIVSGKRFGSLSQDGFNVSFKVCVYNRQKDIVAEANVCSSVSGD